MFIHLNGNPFRCEQTGSPSAMPVVFLHGFPFSHEMWKHQLDVVGRSYRAIAYDLRGHGESFVGDGQFTVEQHVDDLLALLDHWEIEKTVIVGLSMGGYIALRALERAQGRFKAAVLADTRSESDSNESKQRRFASMVAVKKHGSAAFAEEFVKAVFAPGSFLTKHTEVQNIRSIIAHTPPLSIAGTLLALASRMDTTQALTNISIPVLILVGEQDVTTPPAASQAMHERIPNSEFHIIPQAAHMSNLENADAFNDVLLKFLRRVATMSA